MGNGSIPLSGFGKPFNYMLKPPIASKISPETSRPSKSSSTDTPEEESIQSFSLHF
jgi:hypothetical protein